MPKVDDKFFSTADSLLKTIESSPNARFVIYLICGIVVLFIIYSLVKLFYTPAFQQRIEKVLNVASQELKSMNISIQLLLDRQNTFQRISESIFELNNEIKEKLSVVETKIDERKKNQGEL